MNEDTFVPLADGQLADLELHHAAYHEAGHHAMYRHYGSDGDTFIWKNMSDDPSEVCWNGQFRPRVCPQQVHLAKIRGGSLSVLPENWRALVGMAGLVAEEIFRGITSDTGIIYDFICQRISCGEASATDLFAMNITDTDDFVLLESDVAMAWSHLIAEWAFVSQEAERLIEGALNV